MPESARLLTLPTWAARVYEDDPPSFHEIRSLAARTYKAEGRDPQDLLGHKDAETTAVYLDGRQQKWVKVAA